MQSPSEIYQAEGPFILFSPDSSHSYMRLFIMVLENIGKSHGIFLITTHKLRYSCSNFNRSVFFKFIIVLPS